MTPATGAAGAAVATSLVVSLGGARRADLGRTRFDEVSSSGAGSGAGRGAVCIVCRLPSGATMGSAAGGGRCCGSCPAYGSGAGGRGGGGGGAAWGGGAPPPSRTAATAAAESVPAVAAVYNCCRKMLVFSGSIPATTLPTRMWTCCPRAYSTQVMIFCR
jgi:hypothetical protein